MWDVKRFINCLNICFHLSFTLTMWDVKDRTKVEELYDIYAFYLNYVGCKVH